MSTLVPDTEVDKAIVPTLVDAIIGVIAGALVLGVVMGAKRLFKGKGGAKPA